MVGRFREFLLYLRISDIGSASSVLLWVTQPNNCGPHTMSDAIGYIRKQIQCLHCLKFPITVKDSEHFGLTNWVFVRTRLPSQKLFSGSAPNWVGLQGMSDVIGFYYVRALLNRLNLHSEAEDEAPVKVWIIRSILHNKCIGSLDCFCSTTSPSKAMVCDVLSVQKPI